MKLLYDAYWDDDLVFLDRAVDFLQSEFGTNSLPKWTSDYMYWKLSELNPAGEGYLYVMVLDGRVIGTATLIKKRILIDGKELIGGEIGDTYSSKKLRRLVKPKLLSILSSDPDNYINKSIFGRCIAEITHRATKDNLFYIYGTPNDNSYPGYTNKLSFIDLKEYNNWSMSTISSKTVIKKLKIPKPLHFGINILGKIATSVNLFRSNYLSLENNLKITDKIPNDDEINNLWNDLKPKKGFSLVRDSKYWVYRYLNHPLYDYKILAIREENILKGIVALKIQKQENNDNIIIISEWMLCKNINFGIFLKLLFNHFKKIKIQKFNLWLRLFSKEFYYAITNGLFPSMRIPIIFFNSDEISNVKNNTKDMSFFIGNTDNV